MDDAKRPPDYGLIAPIALPADGLIPDPASGQCGQEEYDAYFRLVRGQPDLTEWSRSCLTIQQRMLDDLEHSALPAQERAAIMKGCLVIVHNTLKCWVDVADSAEGTGGSCTNR